MAEKYKTGDVVLLTQKKAVKNNKHYVILNGIRYDVSKDFDGLLAVICYRPELGAYYVKELHGDEPRKFNIPPRILERYSKYARPRNKFNVGDIVLVTPKGERAFGDYREYKVGDTWLPASLGNSLRIVAVNDECELYLVQGADNAKHSVSWDDLESCSEREDAPGRVSGEATPKDDITEIPLISAKGAVAQQIPDNAVRVYCTKKNSRISIPRSVVRSVVELHAYHFRMFFNNLTDEMFFVFSQEEGVEIPHENFKKNKAIVKKTAVSALAETFKLDCGMTELKLSANLSRKPGTLTYKVTK